MHCFDWTCACLLLVIMHYRVKQYYVVYSEFSVNVHSFVVWLCAAGVAVVRLGSGGVPRFSRPSGDYADGGGGGGCQGRGPLLPLSPLSPHSPLPHPTLTSSPLSPLPSCIFFKSAHNVFTQITENLTNKRPRSYYYVIKLYLSMYLVSNVYY